MDRIETEYDLEMFGKAISEYNDNPITYSLDDVEKELGLQWNTKWNLHKEH